MEIIYRDNIAFNMLKERVGQVNFVIYLTSLGAAYAYPGGRNTTSADDLSLYVDIQGIVRMRETAGVS